MDGQGHLLSLKVMRISRPSIASSWEPFYSSSPSFSAHSTASILSLQGATPLPDHPKTLRDLSHATTFLALPPAFGAIQLGETFSACLCLNNDSPNVPVGGVYLRVEMQTGSAKFILTEIGRDPNAAQQHDTAERPSQPEVLEIGKSLECLVTHEMKELGQHVLACSVSYIRPSPSGRPPSNTDIQSFRKFYKFAVTNPLSVKTKVHIPRSPSALMSRTEREKVFLEVHIQNLTQEPMWFERMRFECADGWEADDPNQQSRIPLPASSSSSLATLTATNKPPTTAIEEVPDSDAEDPVFKDIMQPQDARQYVYTLYPSASALSARNGSNFAPLHPPGAVVSLGRLDISWRSSFGEPGRLLTSMLSRRIPLPPSGPPANTQPPPASAIPPHLQRSVGSPSRPSSPQLPYSALPQQPFPSSQPNAAQQQQRPPSRPGTPPASPAAYRPRTRDSLIGRPQSPTAQANLPSMNQILRATPSPQPPPAPLPVVEAKTDLEVDLVVKRIPKNDDIHLGDTFDVEFTATLSGLRPTHSEASEEPRKKRRRVLQLVVQHIQPWRRGASLPPSAPAPPLKSGAHAPHFPSALAMTQSPSRAQDPRLSSLAHNNNYPNNNGITSGTGSRASGSGMSTPTRGSTLGSTTPANFATGLAERLKGVVLSEEPLPIVPVANSVSSSSAAPSDVSGALDEINFGERRHREFVLPSPIVNNPKGGRNLPLTSAVMFIGDGAVFLRPILFDAEDGSEDATPTLAMHNGGADDNHGHDEHRKRAEVARDFSLSYHPLKPGFMPIGGVRILVVSDRVVESGSDMYAALGSTSDGGENEEWIKPLDRPPLGEHTPVRTLKEVDVLAEVWVRSPRIEGGTVDNLVEL